LREKVNEMPLLANLANYIHRMTIQAHLSAIRGQLQNEIKPGRAEAMLWVAPGIQQVMGVPVPVLNALSRVHKAGGIPLVERLWASGVYEERLLAVKILAHLVPKSPDEALRLVQEFMPDITEWTICDTLGCGISRRLHKTHRNEIFSLSARWLRSKHMWYRRMSLVLLLYFCRFPECREEIQRRVDLLATDREHYIRKAVTWARRELKGTSKNSFREAR